jgi:hypothetical protein
LICFHWHGFHTGGMGIAVEYAGQPGPPRWEAPPPFVWRGDSEAARFVDAQRMTIEDVYGDYGLTPYDASGSPRLILVARMGPASCASALGTRQVFADAA